ncbi:MAG: NAD(P)/FAD-dependent oxidoreductase, partial [Candidatus Ranarchaeia archaeon]
MPRSIVVIGCGAAGTNVAVHARKFDRNAKILVATQENRPEYSRCGLPHAITGVIPAFSDLQEHPAEWYERALKVDLRLGTRCIKIDTKSKEVTLERLDDKEKETVSYDALVLAVGAQPAKPPITGVDSPGIFTLRTMEDAIEIQKYAEKSKSALIVGAGLTALELAESLNMLKVKTSVAVRSVILRTMVDKDLGERIRERGEAEGIEFFVGHTV